MLKAVCAVAVLCQAISGIYGQGVTLKHNTVPVNDFDLLDHSVIGDSTDPDNHLTCRTDNTSCCRNGDSPNGEGFGDWYYPDGSVVFFPGDGDDLPTGQIYRMLRNSRTIVLHREGSATASTANGIYRCVVADQNGVIQTRYVGLYTETTAMPNGVGVVSISQAPQFSLISVDPLEFTLSSTTTGGPPTSAQWTLPDTSFVDPGDTFSQRVVDAMAATVEHILTMTGRVTGTYTFSTTNPRSGAPVSRTIVIEDANPPSGLMAVQSGATSVNVSWTAPVPGGTTLIGYRIFYETGSSEQSVDAGAGATSHTLTGLQSGATYSITIVALSNTLSSTVLGPGMVILQMLEIPVVTTEVLNSTSIRVTFTQPSGSLAAERYDIQYTRVVGDGQELCPNRNSTDDTMTATDVTSSYAIMSLQEFSTYDITVTAVSDDAMEETTVRSTTLSAAPSAAPRNLVNTTVLSTSITVGWASVMCIDRNGVIDNYIVRFGPEGGAQSERTVQSEGADVAGTYTASGLTPFTNYSFDVAAMNIIDTGPFTAQLTVVTDEDLPGPVRSLQSSQNFSTVTITWVEPEVLNGTIVRYEITYSPLNDPANIETVDTGLTLSFTLSNLTAGMIFTFNVTAFTRVGGGPSVSINAGTIPPVVEGVMVTVISNTAVNVSWDRVESEDITRYTVFYRLEPGGRKKRQTEMTRDFPGTASSGLIDNLMPNALYSFTVVAFAAFGGVTIEGVRPPSPIIMRVTVEMTEMTEMTEDPSPTPVEGGEQNVIGIVVGIIVAVVCAIAIIAVIIIVVVVLRRRGSGKSSYSPTAKSAPIPLLASTDPAYGVQQKLPENYLEKEIIEPCIEEFPEDTHVTEGESAFFRITVSGHPKPNLSWYHDGAEVQADYSMELKEDGSLAINSSEPRHTGVYQMVAKNEAGSSEREVKLYVHIEDGEAPAVQKKTVVLQPIPVAEFGEHVARGHANNNRVFRDQYTALDSGDEYPKTIGLSAANKKFNRFANIAVYDRNRITLKPMDENEDCQREYINACYVDGYSKKNKFIATQGPLPKTIVDFWRLVWQEKVCTIVMVTNLKEGSKAKCQQYWPDTSTASYGPFDVTITDSQLFADYTVRTFQVSLAGSSSRSLKVTQYHFTAWPDHGVPDYATPILAYHRRVISQHRPSRGPMLVHCSAGIGRTGTFICIDMVLEQIKAEKLVDISGTINQLRNQRMKMVQTPEQYVFINDAILESVTCGDTQISATNLRTSIQKMSRVDSTTHKTTFESQFHVLDQVSPKPNEVNCATALEYPDRNRSKEYLPADRYRVLLKGEHPDYIHAAFVHGYKQQKAFIVTQGPMKSTSRDFWKMVYDKKCGAIVALSELRENEMESTYQYWPTSGVLEFGGYTVDLLGEEKLQGFTIRTLSVLDNKSGKAHQVTQFHIMNWTPDGRCSNMKSVVDAIDEVAKVQRKTGNHPIVVHCSDTVSRSGMFCAIATTIERCKTEGVVDVFQVVKALRVQKPGSVLTVVQYQAVFEAVLVFLDSFDTYANFQNV